MYIFCNYCDWEQDDFWGKESYTPLRKDIIDHLKMMLFEDRIYFDLSFFRDGCLKPDGSDEKGHYVRGTTYVAWDLRRRADQIEIMQFRTIEEFENRGTDKWVCPKCNGQLILD